MLEGDCRRRDPSGRLRRRPAAPRVPLGPPPPPWIDLIDYEYLKDKCLADFAAGVAQVSAG